MKFFDRQRIAVFMWDKAEIITLFRGKSILKDESPPKATLGDIM